MDSRWEPDQDKVEKRKKYLESLFSQLVLKPDDDFLTDCAKISVFLEDEKAVARQLKELNRLLKEKLAEANLVAGAKGSMKLLRSILEKELGDMGFYPRFGQASRFISDTDFRYTLSKGLLIKDSPFRQATHGEFTHAIQWLLISWQNREAPFLSEATINVFKKFGDPVTSTPNANLWDEVVDASTLANNFFRAPGNLNLYIEEHPQEFECLEQSIRYRSQKPAPRERKFDTPEKQQKYEKTKPGLFEPKTLPADADPHEPKQKKP